MRRAILLFALILCSPLSVQAESSFRIGVIAPLTGGLSEYGLAAQHGIELARIQHPELFSTIQIYYEDSQWDAKQSVSALKNLQAVKNVNLVFNWGNPTTEAVAPLAERSHLPLLGMSLDPGPAIGKKYVVRTTNSAHDFAAAVSHHLVKRGYKKIGVVLADNTYVRGLFDGMRKALGSDAQLLEIDTYPLSAQDFRPSIAKIRSSTLDSLGVFLITGQVSNFYRQMREQAVSIPTFGTDFFESSTEISLAGGGMNGAVYPHLGVSEKFRADYTARYGNDYQLAYAGNAYDVAVILGKLFDKTTPTADEIMAKLRAIKDEHGIGGVFEFRDTPSDGPHLHFPVQVKEIVNGTIRPLSDATD